ncbi:MAG: U32 family peptidase, partial [Clostridia bacterium]|nr:U32 family peptidase [Clostridia bacterium]
MKKHIELLAPAGSFDSLKAAIANGADAVYLGGGRFNARINAGNFTEQELVSAFDYAHDRDVKVYVTLNTLIKNDELPEAIDFSAFCYEQGADAIIVQDLGLLDAVSKAIPDLTIHASTQMTVTSSASILELEKLGVKRVVLARELSLSEIKAISQSIRAELEVFVHGALCVCYSGQCLMSSFIGGRSGNRGTCAQPCRLPWSVARSGAAFSQESYLISPRDLMALELLPELLNAGVSSLKLEGRMKSPEYVAIVTGIYRKYLDLALSGEEDFAVEPQDRTRLLQAFNRGGFTQSYLKGEKDYRKLVYTRHPKNQGVSIGQVTEARSEAVKIRLDAELHMGDGLEIMDPKKGPQSMIVTSMVQNGQHARFAAQGSSLWVGDLKALISQGSMVYRTLSKPLFEEARLSYEREGRSAVPIEVWFYLKVGAPARLIIRDAQGREAEAFSEKAAEQAINRPLAKERVEEQLSKTGETPYKVRNITFETDGLSTIPIASINAMRRDALEELQHKRVAASKRVLGKEYKSVLIKDLEPYFPGHDLSLTAHFYKMPHTLEGLEGKVGRVYLPLGHTALIKELRKQFSGELYLWTPNILKDTEFEDIILRLKELDRVFNGLAVGNLGAFERIKEVFPSCPFTAEASFNSFNDYTVSLLYEQGIGTVVLSPELRLSEVKDFSHLSPSLEAVVYGRSLLMTMEYCPSAGETGCSQRCESCPGSKGELKDRKGEVFPFVRDPVFRRTSIYNAHPMLMDDVEALKDSPLNRLRLVFTNETEEQVESIVSYYEDRLKKQKTAPKVLESIEKMKAAGCLLYTS